MQLVATVPSCWVQQGKRDVSGNSRGTGTSSPQPLGCTCVLFWLRAVQKVTGIGVFFYLLLPSPRSARGLQVGLQLWRSSSGWAPVTDAPCVQTAAALLCRLGSSACRSVKQMKANGQKVNDLARKSRLLCQTTLTQRGSGSTPLLS